MIWDIFVILFLIIIIKFLMQRKLNIELGKAEKEKNAVQQKLSNIRDKHSRIFTQKEELERSRNDLQAKFNEVMITNEALSQENNYFRKEVDKQKAEITHLEIYKSELSEASAKLKTIEQSFSQTQISMKKNERNNARLTERSEKLETENKQLKKMVSDLNSTKRSYDLLQPRYEKLDKQLREQNEKVIALETLKRENDRQIRTLEQTKSKQKFTIQRLERTEQEYEKSKRELAKAKSGQEYNKQQWRLCDAEKGQLSKRVIELQALNNAYKRNIDLLERTTV